MLVTRVLTIVSHTLSSLSQCFYVAVLLFQSHVRCTPQHQIIFALLVLMSDRGSCLMHDWSCSLRVVTR